MSFESEVKRRRTFAIVSHPDAGKTTLTEKLLLFGGAIHIAGAVKSNKIKKTATSDFMEIERQRGISVSTSVMAFEYKDLKINILDTPGHQDFAEDTYRTLTAVDSAIVVVDAAKGVEAQTEKLVNVCSMRKTPMIIFVNKMDREGKDIFELLDEIEHKLKLKVRPLTWNIGIGRTFKGVYNVYNKTLNLFSGTDKQRIEDDYVAISDLNSEEIIQHIGEAATSKLREELELIESYYQPFEVQDYLDGNICPVFFGSALNNFGVQELLDCFTQIAPYPQPRPTKEREIDPFEEKFSGFIFKIHANMDPNHRDRIAFVKICSGIFERNKNYLHVRQGKQMKFSSPTSFMADKKSIIDIAYTGDIIGLHDTGNFKIGDTLSEGEILHFTGIPTFSPELFRYIENADPLKSKQLAKGIEQLTDEGVAQLFTKLSNGRKVIGTVGPLQFEVIEYRLKHEYGATSRYEGLSLYKACWLEGDKKEMEDFKTRKYQYMAVDKHGRDVFMADSQYTLDLAVQNFPNIKFFFKAEY